jgi:hypothetical protein
MVAAIHEGKKQRTRVKNPRLTLTPEIFKM